MHPLLLSCDRPAAVRLQAKKGGGFSEFHENREYRPGDSVRDIHWKLSGKTDKLIVRQAMEPVQRRLVLAVETCGSTSEPR